MRSAAISTSSELDPLSVLSESGYAREKYCRSVAQRSSSFRVTHFQQRRGRGVVCREPFGKGFLLVQLYSRLYLGFGQIHGGIVWSLRERFARDIVDPWDLGCGVGRVVDSA